MNTYKFSSDDHVPGHEGAQVSDFQAEPISDTRSGMPEEQQRRPPRVRYRSTRLVGMRETPDTPRPAPGNIPDTPWPAPGSTPANTPVPAQDIASQPTAAMQLPGRQAATQNTSARSFYSSHAALLDVSEQSTSRLMQLSGMMRAVSAPQGRQPGQDAESLEDGWWPEGIQQTGVFPVVNIYGREPFGRSMPVPAVAAVALPRPPARPQPAWRAFLGLPIVKVTLGLLIGVGLLILVSRFVDFSETLHVLRQNLATPRGIIFGLLSGVSFLLAYSIRGVRWKLFLNPIGKISTLKAIQLFLVGVFLNFLLPVRGGEVAKSLMLKRIANIPISQSLPTVAMDKALDLLPVLFILALVPLLGIQMDIRVWLVLGLVGGLLLGLFLFVGFAAWKRTAAIALLQKLTSLLPKVLGGKIEGFATGFVDSLLAGASRPRIFIPALLLTCIAVLCDGLFAMLAFWTIGFPISFGTALFGYTVYIMFYILPTTPGEVGSNEAVGLLVFSGLLHLPPEKVTAMFLFSHPWAALLMCVSGMICLSALGLTITSAMRVRDDEAAPKTRVRPKERAIHA
ncbi:MAG: flippase-like domain-containing protein [Chloroflexota bacterium]|nr:flippase-like domain-containing protein [Chloroflexota bacterium]